MVGKTVPASTCRHGIWIVKTTATYRNKTSVRNFRIGA
jgi:hypothetical protein